MMNKKYSNSSYHLETRRKVILNRNSSAAEVEKWEDQISSEASIFSADLQEYWDYGIDSNLYLDETAARAAHEEKNPIPTVAEYLAQLNSSRESSSTAVSYEKLTEFEKLMFRSQMDIKNTVKREDWKQYQIKQQIFRNDNARLIVKIAESINSHYLQFLTDTQDWKKETSKNKVNELKTYLRNRTINIHGPTAIAVERKEELWQVEFGNVPNYEKQISDFKVKLRSYLECLSRDRRVLFNTDLENVFRLRYKLTHSEWSNFHLTSHQFQTLDDLIEAIELENLRLSSLKKNLFPKRQLVVNLITEHNSSNKSSSKRVKYTKNDFKPSNSINWNEVGDNIRKLPKPGDGKESSRPCCYCNQSKISRVKENSKNHAGIDCFQRYPTKKK